MTFSLKLQFTPLFGEFLWHIFPYDVTHRHDPQKDRPWAETRCLREIEPFSVGIGAVVRAGRVKKKKLQDNKEVTKVLYFTYLLGSP